jgi:hypothetical protein
MEMKQWLDGSISWMVRNDGMASGVTSLFVAAAFKPALSFRQDARLKPALYQRPPV